MMQRPLSTDPIARAIGNALRPGHFISSNAGRSFITVLEMEQNRQRVAPPWH